VRPVLRLPLQRQMVLWLQGGLGNQLFQLSSGLSLSSRQGVPMRISRASYMRDGLRDFAIRPLVESSTLLNLGEELILGRPYRRDGSMRRALWPSGLAVVDADDGADHLMTGTVVLGFGQTARHLGLPTVQVTHRLAALRARVKHPALDRVAGGTVAHVRRGDYVTSDSAARQFGVLSASYYFAALEALGTRVAEVTFFTDDPAYVCRAFGVTRSSVIGPDDTRTDLESLLIMSAAGQMVIANSTFSWWAAETAGPSTTVCAPEEWFPGSIGRESLARAYWKTFPHA
jgi:hypothetical protein